MEMLFTIQNDKFYYTQTKVNINDFYILKLSRKKFSDENIEKEKRAL